MIDDVDSGALVAAVLLAVALALVWGYYGTTPLDSTNGWAIFTQGVLAAVLLMFVGRVVASLT